MKYMEWDSAVDQMGMSGQQSKSNKEMMENGYRDVVGTDWDLYVRISPRDKQAERYAKYGHDCFWHSHHRPSTQYLKKRFNGFLKNLNRTGTKFYENRIRVFVVYEQNPKPHLHALIKGIKPELAGNLRAKCFRAFGNSKVEPYDPQKGACHYLAKKLVCAKEGIDWDGPHTIHARPCRKGVL